MSVTRLSPLCLVLLLASSALGTYPFAYPDLQAPLPFSPHLIYGSGIGRGNADLTGFSYFTKDFGGGESDVVFFTGPNSVIKMNDEVASVKDQMSSWPSTTAETKTDKDDAAVKSDSGENQDVAKTAPPTPVETKESSTPAKGEEATSKTTKSEEDKKDADPFQGILNGQFLPDNGVGFDAPYPIHRLGGGSGLFYPQLSTSFTGFSGYEPSDYFRSQYVPIYNQYNSYQRLYNPFYSLLDTDYYNPGTFSSFYQTPIIAPSSPPSNYLPAQTQKDSGTKLPVDNRLGEAEVSSVASTTENSDQKKGGDDSTSEKGTELPTTTEQLVEKSTTVSEAAPTTSDDIKETTTVVTDAVAVP